VQYDDFCGKATTSRNLGDVIGLQALDEKNQKTEEAILKEFD
jgi:hypothetical protein